MTDKLINVKKMFNFEDSFTPNTSITTKQKFYTGFSKEVYNKLNLVTYLKLFIKLLKHFKNLEFKDISIKL